MRVQFFWRVEQSLHEIDGLLLLHGIESPNRRLAAENGVEEFTVRTESFPVGS